MITETANPDIASARSALVNDAYNHLVRQLTLLAQEIAMESGPYRVAAAALAGFANRTRENVSRIADAARLLSDVVEPLDPSVIELRRFGDRIQREIIAPLQEAGRLNETAAKAAFREVGKRLSSLLKDSESRLASDHTVEKVIVAVDVERYSSLASTLHQASGVEAVSALNDEIERVIRDSIKQIEASPEESLIVTTGDGAILAFDRSDEAHEFASALHHFAQQSCLKRLSKLQLNFRVGVSSGPVTMEKPRSGHSAIVGMPIVNAVRLESAAGIGEVLMSEDSWARLPKRIQNLYGPSEVVAGKRNERIAARRCRFVTSQQIDLRVGSVGSAD